MEKVKMNCKKIQKTKGFTLIELIVVMAIILIMASFLIPKFNGYRGRAERLKAIDTGRQIYLSAMESYMENNGKFNGNKIKETSKELLGIDDLNVISASEDNVVINYKIDKKKYSLNFNKNTSSFNISDKNGSIYPEIDHTEIDSKMESDGEINNKHNLNEDNKKAI